MLLMQASYYMLADAFALASRKFWLLEYLKTLVSPALAAVCLLSSQEADVGLHGIYMLHVRCLQSRSLSVSVFVV